VLYHKRHHRKYSNTWRWKITLLNEEIRGKIKKFLESEENENTIY
jgi:hypothetical protein